MSWLYSQALAEAFLEDASSDGALSVPLKSTPTPLASWSHGKTTGFSRLSRYGMTLERLTDDHGAALLTWFQAASRVRISATPANRLALTGRDPGYGGRWRESFVRYDRATSSWKTHQTLWAGVLPESSVTLPRWGMTRGGVLWEPGTSVRLTGGIESGSLWPTPTVNDSKSNGTDSQLRRNGLNLNAAVRIFPTPTATDGTKWNNATPTERKAQGRSVRLPNVIAQGNGGKLNPRWVEWLMGWPIGWTSLEPLATARFRQWFDAHGGY